VGGGIWSVSCGYDQAEPDYLGNLNDENMRLVGGTHSKN